MKKLFLTLPGLLAVMGSCVSHAAELTLKFEDIRSSKGRLLVAVYDSQTAFETQSDNQAIASFNLPATAGMQGVTLHDLPEGRYAVSLHHDENDNGEFDLNGRNFPLEGFAFSNNVGADKEVTEFSEAAFDVGEGSTRQNMTLVYIK
ncbi:DUF2141 domain-containing protein [Kiloniella sp. b19]|uniref:DUF2141 domain-containing protein n=1 Tax=Kiloniella sp. GXU_MW_B19 TaxID=3141326 RepID=UPI0031D01D61